MTKMHMFREWILLSLGELGGTAPRARVLEEIERRWSGWFTGDDRLYRAGRNEPAWQNRTDSARNTLIDRGRMYPTDVSGDGVWALTPIGEAERVRLARAAQPPRAGGSSCPAFREAAGSVVARMREGRIVGRVSGETTFTDNIVHELAVNHAEAVRIEVFPTAKEAHNGADWEFSVP